MKKTSKYIISAVLIFCLILAAQAALLLASDLLKPRVEEAIKKRLDADVTINGFDINPFTGVHIDSLIIDSDPSKQCKSSGIRLSDIDIDHAVSALLTGSYRITDFEIADMDACLDTTALKGLLAGGIIAGKKGRTPGVKIQNGSISFSDRLFKKPLQIKDINISAPGAENYEITGIAFFAGDKNSININMETAKSVVKADLQVKDFDILSMPEINIPEKIFNMSLPESETKLTGSISAVFSTQTGMITIKDGQLLAASGCVDIYSGAARIDKNGIQQARLRAGTRGLNLKFLNGFNQQQILPAKFRTELREGRLNTDLQLRWNREQGLQYEAEASVHNGSAYLPGLETRLNSIEAELEIYSPEKVVIKTCRGWTSEGRVDISGFLDFKDRKINDHRVEFQFTEITPNTHIMNLLPSEARQVIKKMKVQNAEFGGRIIVARDAVNIDLAARAESARVPDTPFKLSSPATRIKWTSGTKKIFFDDIKAFVDKSPVEGRLVLDIDEPLSVNFSFSGQYLPISPELIQWLGMEKEQWKINGSYDIRLRAREWNPQSLHSSEIINNLNLRVDLREGSVHHQSLGLVADNWYGHLAINSGQLRLKSFTGDVFGIGFRANGSIPIEEKSNTILHVDSEIITLNEDLYQRLPSSAFLQNLNLQGQCKLKAELQSGDSGIIPTKGNIAAVIHHLEMQPNGVKLETGGTARVNISGLNTGNIGLDGSVNLNEMYLDRFDANRISAAFSYRDEKLEIPEIRVNAYGGIIRFTDSSINISERKWQTRIQPAHMDLESIVAAMGITGKDAPSGNLRGEIDLKGKGFDPEALRGGGNFKISKGILYNFPVIASVFNVLDLEMPHSSPITHAYGTFGIQDGELELQDLLLSGGTVPMYMKGTLGLKKGVAFKNQRIDLLVTAAKSNGILDQIPLVGWIKHYTLDMFRRLIMQVRLEGTVGDYQVQSISSPVTKPIEQMWSLMEKLAPSAPEK
ncbi:MAG: AsmA-like C-terminal region-containing protein [Desulfobacteraceae bacterium]|nr:AsmA-like C-terminal region-containing protein [Desulfobacteraceae bacterium]